LDRSRKTARSGKALGGALVILSAAPWAWAAEDATQKLYEEKCLSCHTADGNAPVPEMNFVSGPWVHGSRIPDIVKVITDGVPGKAMNPFKDQLTKAQIDALARYVRSFDKRLKKDPGK
jgi:mono/diheme cytochrome c family protein